MPESAAATFAASTFGVRDRELFVASVGPSSCGNFGKLPHDHDNCGVRVPANDNNFRNFRRPFSPARDNSSKTPCADDALAVAAAVCWGRFAKRLMRLCAAT